MLSCLAREQVSLFISPIFLHRGGAVTRFVSCTELSLLFALSLNQGASATEPLAVFHYV